MLAAFTTSVRSFLSIFSEITCTATMFGHIISPLIFKL
ncbi:putative membrane protein [Escherichia coli DEC15C]|nr:putative membrane protein [Escherichia coli DEC15C]EHY15550.1 putative membrane protein [Escherichia coli DEC15D]